MDTQTDTTPTTAPHPPLAPAVADRLKAALGPKGWSDDPLRVGAKTEDWRGRYKGWTPFLALPANTAEVAQILKICAEEGLAVTPQGGNSGLVGGGTPFGEILISTERMRQVRSIDAHNNSMVVDAGVVLTSVHAAATEAGRFFPLSLGAQGVATVGGLIATNAGGVAVLRYGMMRALVLGLEVVLADGRVLSDLSALRKDNTGYDLKQLFIGSEGTLGVITGAALKLFTPPAAKIVAFCGLESPDPAPEFLAEAQALSGDAVTAFEIIPALALDLVLQHVPGTRRPLAYAHPWHLLVELSLGHAEGADDTMERVLAAALEAGHITDAVIASNETQAADFWKLRETIAEAEKAHGPAIKHDVSAPVSAMPRLIAEASQAAKAVAPDADIIAFGHVGDGNVHFNVAMPAGGDRTAFLARQSEMHAAVHDVVARLGGSISAEHGVGVLKREELARRADPVRLELMRAIKQALDPEGRMNPRVLL